MSLPTKAKITISFRITYDQNNKNNVQLLLSFYIVEATNQVKINTLSRNDSLPSSINKLKVHLFHLQFRR